MPYSPRIKPLNSLVTILYRSPVITLYTAWVPTIWEDGVTNGGYPLSFRTAGTSRNTSISLSSLPACFSWLTRLDSMPPGTWYCSVLASTASILGFNCPLSRYFSRSFMTYGVISLKLSKSIPVSYSVPFRAATIDSVAGCDVPSAKGDIAVSITSAPASMALSITMEARPEV